MLGCLSSQHSIAAALGIEVRAVCRSCRCRASPASPPHHAGMVLGSPQPPPRCLSHTQAICHPVLPGSSTFLGLIQESAAALFDSKHTEADHISGWIFPCSVCGLQDAVRAVFTAKEN